MLTFIQSSVVI